MIDPESADEATAQILMAIADLGIGAFEMATSAPEDLSARFARLRQLGLDQAHLAEAGEAVMRHVRPVAS